MKRKTQQQPQSRENTRGKHVFGHRVGVDERPVRVEPRILLNVACERIEAFVETLGAVDLFERELEGLRRRIRVPAQRLDDLASQGANPRAHDLDRALRMQILTAAEMPRVC